MKKINKVLIAFIATISLGIFWILSVIQSEDFSVHLVSRFSKILKSVKGPDIKFKNLEILVFPPGIQVNQVEMKWQKLDEEVHSFFQSVRIELNYIDFLRSRPRLGKIYISEGPVSYKGKTKKEKSSIDLNKISHQDVFDEYQKIQKRMPILPGEVHIRNVYVKTPWAEGMIDNSSMYLKDGVLDINLRSRNFLSSKKLFLDKIKLGVQLSKTSLRLKTLEVRKDQSKIKGELTIIGREINDGGLSIDLEGRNFREVLGIERHFFKGNIQADIKFEGPMGKGLEVLANVKLKNIENKYFKAKEASLIVGVDKELNVFAEKISVKIGKSRLNSMSRRNIFNLERTEIISGETFVTAENVFSNDILYFVKETLDPMKFKFTGKAKLLWSDQGLVVVVKGGELSDVALDFEKKDKVFDTKKLFVKSFNIDIPLGRKSPIVLSGDVSTNRSDLLSFSGKIGDVIDVDIVTDRLDLENVGKVSGVKIKGESTGQIKVASNYDETFFNFKMLNSGLNIEEIIFGNVQADFIFDLKRMRIKLMPSEGDIDKSLYTAQGEIELSPFNLKIEGNYSGFKYQSIKKLLSRFLSNNKVIPGDEFQTKITGSYSLQGPLELEGIDLKSSFQGKKLRYYDEYGQNFKGQFKFQKGAFSLNVDKLAIGNGLLDAAIKTDLVQELTTYNARPVGIRIEKLGFSKRYLKGLEGLIGGEVKQSILNGREVLNIDLELLNTKILGVKRPRSSVRIISTKESASYDLALINKSVVANGMHYFDYGKKSKINVEVKSNRIRDLVGPYFGDLVARKELDGELSSRINFSYFRPEELNGEFKISKFEMSKTDNFLNLDRPVIITFKEGKIKRIEGVMNGPRGQKIRLFGKGIFSKNIEMGMNYLISLDWAEILHENIVRSRGPLEGRYFAKRIDGGPLDFLGSFKGQKIFFVTDKIPRPLTQLDFSGMIKNRDMKISYFKGLMGGGRLKGNADLIVNFPYPEVRARVEVQEARISPLKGVNLRISFKGNIQGPNPPYQVKGNAQIKQLKVELELDEILSASGRDLSHIKYLPRNKKNIGNDFLELDVDLEVESASNIRNTIADIYFGGKFDVSGVARSPTKKGIISFEPGRSKLVFKGHEFTINEGTIQIDDINRVNSHVNIASKVTIQEYDIVMQATGHPSSVSFRFSSVPPLPQEDILSLITLGVTTDVQEGLESKDRESITSLGLGTLLADQLKINRKLQQRFGMKLSILPEFSDEGDNLLSGRTSSGDASGRYRSATRIRIDKNIADGLNLSISSRVGGQLERRNEMDLKYKVNKNIFLQGIIEDFNEPGRSNERRQSYGGDFIFRFPF